MFHSFEKTELVWRCFVSCCFAWNWICISFCWNKRLFALDVGCCSVCMVWWHCNIRNHKHYKNKARRSTRDNPVCLLWFRNCYPNLFAEYWGCKPGRIGQISVRTSSCLDRNRCDKPWNSICWMFCGADSVLQRV